MSWPHLPTLCSATRMGGFTAAILAHRILKMAACCQIGPYRRPSEAARPAQSLARKLCDELLQ